MDTTIHPTALVDPKAELDDGVEVGPFAVIEANVKIGRNCKIGPHAHIAQGARLSSEVKVHTGAVLATIPQDLKFEMEETTLEVGERTVIREYATLNRGTHDRWKTSVGSDCLIMAYAHVAHDCMIGNHCILANSVNLAGHVVLEDWVSIGGLVPVHQFVRIGQHSFIGGGFRVPKDVPPYILALGEPLTFGGLNSVGLTRRGFSQEIMLQIKRAYRTIFKSNLNVSQALTKIRENGEMTAEVRNVIDFIEKSERGIIG
jgi:UDP-N-acetylglucosamine acyltransferase